MAVGVYSIRSAMARIVVPSYPTLTNSSRAASRIILRVSARWRARRSRLLTVPGLQHLNHVRTPNAVKNGCQGLRRPLRGEQLRLLDHGLRRLLLLVRRVAVLAQDAADHDAEPCPYVLAHGPVDGDVVADRVHQLPRD